uniref:Type II restriction enzyme, putative n=1 Tax=uncultured marine bacterium 580 TaxID=257400 RepID=Q6SFK8_9BACT|nr:type II restriction enzyme, putative [uncultured marine bacterium 580]
MEYDASDKNSVYNFAKKLTGKTLRDVLSPQIIQESEKLFINNGNKGRFGHKIEKHYFGYDINSDKEADFSLCKLELKVTPMKLKNDGSLTPKERLVNNIINFDEIVKETWHTSSLLKKINSILLIRYLDPMNKEINQLDYKILDVQIINLSSNAEDFNQFEKDWNLIVNKIKDGKAHELSESDTMYLGACTKGENKESQRSQPYSSEKAMQRAFSFKTQYMKILLDRCPGMYDYL